jgi:hypothetical protein
MFEHNIYAAFDKLDKLLLRINAVLQIHPVERSKKRRTHRGANYAAEAPIIQTDYG